MRCVLIFVRTDVLLMTVALLNCNSAAQSLEAPARVYPRQRQLFESFDLRVRDDAFEQNDERLVVQNFNFEGSKSQERPIGLQVANRAGEARILPSLAAASTFKCGLWWRDESRVAQRRQSRRFELLSGKLAAVEVETHFDERTNGFKLRELFYETKGSFCVALKTPTLPLDMNRRAQTRLFLNSSERDARRCRRVEVAALRRCSRPLQSAQLRAIRWSENNRRHSAPLCRSQSSVPRKARSFALRRCGRRRGRRQDRRS